MGELIRARVARQKELKAALGSPEELHSKEVDEMWKWVKICLMIAFPLCTISLIKDQIIVEHDHRPDGALPEYMKIRHKPYPWTCSDCDLFDMQCWKQCKAEKKAAGGH